MTIPNIPTTAQLISDVVQSIDLLVDLASRDLAAGKLSVHEFDRLDLTLNCALIRANQGLAQTRRRIVANPLK
jgi:hypothetical protein